MTPELIALLLGSSLPMRLALLDADPTGAGWYVGRHRDSSHGYASLQVRASDAMGGTVGAGGAWLPANPLAIVEHAARLKGGGCTVVIRHVGSDWVFSLMPADTYDDPWGPVPWMLARSQDKCPHTATVALLREVVGV
jgi:hypothetical protein